MIGQRITSDEQLRRWVSGESVHRLIDDVEGGECCPDFSCCKPKLMADESIRRAFASASDQERFTFLGHFLGAAIAHAQDTGQLDPTKEIVVSIGSAIERGAK